MLTLAAPSSTGQGGKGGEHADGGADAGAGAAQITASACIVSPAARVIAYPWPWRCTVRTSGDRLVVRNLIREHAFERERIRAISFGRWWMASSALPFGVRGEHLVVTLDDGRYVRLYATARTSLSRNRVEAMRVQLQRWLEGDAGGATP